jgi:NAD(P)H-flavin reductase
LVYPWLRTAFEYGFTQKALVNIEGNSFVRLTVLSTNMRWKPGQHCFLRFTSFGLQAFSSHPFTICSLTPLQASDKSELVFYIRHSHGLTKKLYDHACKQPATPVPVLVDGPYGGINLQRFNEANRLLVVAGGSGAGWILSFLELFCRQMRTTGATETTVRSDVSLSDEEKRSGGIEHRRKLRIVLATRDIDSRTWFLEAVAELFAKYSLSTKPDGVDIEVHLTGKAVRTVTVAGTRGDEGLSTSSSADNIEVETKSNGVRAPAEEVFGRPDLPLAIHQESEAARVGNEPLSVYICGPTTMQNDARNAVAKENLAILNGRRSGGVYLHSEHFSWA